MILIDVEGKRDGGGVKGEIRELGDEDKRVTVGEVL
jgi:hypothetical protein